MSKGSDPKRVTLTTISNSAAFNAVAVSGGVVPSSSAGSSTTTASLRFGSDFLTSAQDKASNGASGNDRKGNGNNKTIRLNLELFQTDSCSYPEFNYSKLLHLEKKKIKKLKQRTNGHLSDPFEENDDDVARIAKELEKKYGSTYGSGRGRNKTDDQCDIGLGYDENDSFIDNTEAYDEVIPEEVETIEGGFYINCGALEFKKLHPESTTTKTDEIIKMPNRPKKRVLSSSSEDSSTSEDDDGDSDSEAEDSESDTDETTTHNAKSKSGNSSNEPVEKRQKTAAGSSTTTTTATTSKTKTQENGKKKDKTVTLISCSSSNSPRPTADELGSDSDKERMRQQKTVKTTTVKDMLKAKRDSFLKMQVGSASTEVKNVNGEVKGAATKSSEDESTSDDSDDSDSENSDTNDSGLTSQQQQDKKTKKNTNSATNRSASEENTEKLRTSDTKLPDLESEVVASIVDFKEIVKTKSMTGKKFQFDDKLIEIFLRIDESLLCIEKTQRNMVFAHLEYHLLLPKYYFLRKAKQLRIKEEKMKSKRALGKLRKVVIEAMPGAIASYEVDLRKYTDQEANLNAEHPPKMPKKKFPWNNNLRNLLYEVYQVRWTSYPVLGTRKETLEDFINVYMRDKVVEIWPNGWMRYEELQKEIEKRKNSTKKSKEKKKNPAVKSVANPTTTSTSTVTVTSTNNATVLSNITAAINATATQIKTIPIQQTSSPSSSTYMKQFEEFATTANNASGNSAMQRLIAVNANSDTDSVASSSTSVSTSAGTKRKNTGNSGKHSRSKAQKIHANMEYQQPLSLPQHHTNNTNNGSNGGGSKKYGDLLVSPTKLMLSNAITSASSQSHQPMTANTFNSNICTVASTNVTAPFTSATLQQQKHSNSKTNEPPALPPNVRVIDLDKFKCTSDILETSKQLMSSATASMSANSPVIRRDSSSESDGVEIVGVFPAKPLAMPVATKQKYTKRNEANQHNNRIGTNINPYNIDLINSLNANVYAAAAAAVAATAGVSSSTTTTTTTSSARSSPHNNNNNNNNNNKKSSSGSGGGGGGGGVGGNNNTGQIITIGNSETSTCPGGTNMIDFDVTKVVKVLKELEDIQIHQKSAITPQNASTKDHNSQ